MIRATAISLALMTGAAQALTPAAPCSLNMQSVQQIDPDVYIDQTTAGPGGLTALTSIYPMVLTGGFVDFEWNTGARRFVVLHHCKSDKYLLWSASESSFRKVHDLYLEMFEGETPYTLKQMAAALNASGAKARTGRGGIGRCDCIVTGLDG